MRLVGIVTALAPAMAEVMAAVRGGAVAAVDVRVPARHEGGA